MWQSREKVDLPFIEEFIKIPRRNPHPWINSVPGDYVWQVSTAKDCKTFSSWTCERAYYHQFTSNVDESIEKQRDIDVEEQMAHVVTSLGEAKRDALRAFCKPELAALQSARDACVERMLQWCGDGGDADLVGEVCSASPLFADA